MKNLVLLCLWALAGVSATFSDVLSKLTEDNVYDEGSKIDLSYDISQFMSLPTKDSLNIRLFNSRDGSVVCDGRFGDFVTPEGKYLCVRPEKDLNLGVGRNKFVLLLYSRRSGKPLHQETPIVNYFDSAILNGHYRDFYTKEDAPNYIKKVVLTSGAAALLQIAGNFILGKISTGVAGKVDAGGRIVKPKRPPTPSPPKPQPPKPKSQSSPFYPKPSSTSAPPAAAPKSAPKPAPKPVSKPPTPKPKPAAAAKQEKKQEKKPEKKPSSVKKGEQQSGSGIFGLFPPSSSTANPSSSKIGAQQVKDMVKLGVGASLAVLFFSPIVPGKVQQSKPKHKGVFHQLQSATKDILGSQTSENGKKKPFSPVVTPVQSPPATATQAPSSPSLGSLVKKTVASGDAATATKKKTTIASKSISLPNPFILLSLFFNSLFSRAIDFLKKTSKLPQKALDDFLRDAPNLGEARCPMRVFIEPTNGGDKKRKAKK